MRTVWTYVPAGSGTGRVLRVPLRWLPERMSQCSLLEACNNNRPVNPARIKRDRMFKGPKTPIRRPCVKTKALRTK
jgi:hypothetical protein